jgi:hypothetical protein
MRRIHVTTDFRSTFEARVRAIRILTSVQRSQGEPETIADVARALRETAASVAGEAGDRYRQFALVLGAIEMLVRWARATRSAEPEAVRFLTAARVLAADLAQEVGEDVGALPLGQLAARIRAVSGVNEIDPIFDEAARVPLPLPFFAAETPTGRRGQAAPEDMPEPSPVAVLSFALDGAPLHSPATVKPGLRVDLSVSVSLSRWPDTAEQLVLEAATVENPPDYDLPRFLFPRPGGAGPYQLEARGGLILKVPQSIRSRPLQFVYRAWFTGPAEQIGIAVEGQRQIELQSYDPSETPESGYREVDMRLLEIRSDLRRHLALPDDEIEAFLRVMTTLGALAAQALQDALFEGDWPEDRFHDYARDRLRQNPRIGSELEEHPAAGGGITDLSFRRVRIELKVESARLVTPELAGEFSGQTAQYVAGSDRRLGVLAILDMSPKYTAPHGVVNDLFLKTVEPQRGAKTPIVIGVIVVRGNLARPSDLSRQKAK